MLAAILYTQIDKHYFKHKCISFNQSINRLLSSISSDCLLRSNSLIFCKTLSKYLESLSFGSSASKNQFISVLFINDMIK